MLLTLACENDCWNQEKRSDDHVYSCSSMFSQRTVDC